MNTSIRLYPDYQSLCQAVSEEIKRIILLAVKEKENCFLAISGGSTPRGVYKNMAGELYKDTIPWKHLHIFWCDERCVPPNHPDSNYGQTKRDLLDHVDIPNTHIHRIKGELGPKNASLQYQKELKKYAGNLSDSPKFDLVLLGLGEDGHIASIFPGTEISNSSTVQITQARYLDRPTERVTLTPKVLNNTDNVIFMVSGDAKSTAVKRALEGEFNPTLQPSQYIHPEHGQVLWMIDKEAGKLLSSL